MLRALQELGEYLIDEEDRGGLSDYLSIDKLSSEETLLAIQFRSTDGGYEYGGVTVYDLDGRGEDILYLKDWHNTYDETPTSKIHRIDTAEKKTNRESAVRNDAIDWIFEGWYANAEEDDPLVTSVQAEYQDKEEKIRREVVERWQQTENLDECVLTVQYEGEDGEMHFIGDFDLFVDAVRGQVAENWAEKHGETSRAKNERCTLCHERAEVFGFAFPLALYTVDNRKHAPDFEQADSWQNLPLCGECALDLRVACNFIEDNSFGFYIGDIGDRLEYYVVPNFPLEGPHDDGLMDAFVRGADTDREYSFMAAEGLYDRIEELEYPLSLDLVFYSVEQSQQQVERHVTDVSPPWMREADHTLRETYRDIYGRGDIVSVDYYLDDPEELKQLDTLIYRVLPRTYGSPEAFRTDALDMVEKILKGKSVKYDRVLALADNELRSRFQNDENHRGYALRVFLFLTFLTRLGVLNREGVTTVKDYEEIMADWGENAPDELAAFFDEFPAAFDAPAKRAVFVEGVLAQHLMDVQSQVRSGDPPLRKKLSGLRLNEKRARSLLPRLFQDIDAYDRKSDFPVQYRDLREAAARYFAEADDAGWTISDEEVRYYFTLGTSLNRIFKSDSEAQSEDHDTPQMEADK